MSRTIVALGERLYRIDRDWAVNGPDKPLTGLSSVAFGGDGLVHVLRRERPYLVSFDGAGNVVRRADALDIVDAHGIFAAPDGSLWLTARDGHAVLQVTPGGEVLRVIGDPERPAPLGPFGYPTRAVVAPDGELYVSDGYADALIRRYSSSGQPIGSWGSPGREFGQFRTPHSLWVTEDRVFVVDRDNDRLQVFDRDGNQIAVWPDFVHPMDIFRDDRGRLFVTEDTPRLSMLDDDGTLLGRCRLPSLQCHGITGDVDGNLYVAEVRVSTVTRLALIDAA